MWTFQEYCNATNSWCVRAIQLKAPPPATPTTATSVIQNQPSVNTTVTGTSISGSGFYDPGTDAGGPGYTNHISAAVAGGVIVNSVTFNSATNLTLNVNTNGVAPGFYSVTVTNPDGQSLTGTNILNVTAAAPVTMLSFNAGVFAGNNIRLNWATSLEVNNSGFEVDRSIKGSNSWTSVGFIPGHGTTNQISYYTFSDKKLGVGKYEYRLKQIDYNSNFEYFELNSVMDIGVPVSFGVLQNYPNPSNPKSKIDYQIPFTGKVQIKIYDLLGREVKTLVDETKDAGYYNAVFDGTNLASGIYIYRVEARDASTSLSMTKTMKMVLIK
jgi:Secretion system C-terminal sorting domain